MLVIRKHTGPGLETFWKCWVSWPRRVWPTTKTLQSSLGTSFLEMETVADFECSEGKYHTGSCHAHSSSSIWRMEGNCWETGHCPNTGWVTDRSQNEMNPSPSKGARENTRSMTKSENLYVIRNALELPLSIPSSRDWGMTRWDVRCLKAPGQKPLSLRRTTVQQDWILTTGTRKAYFLLEVEYLTIWAVYQQCERIVH